MRRWGWDAAGYLSRSSDLIKHGFCLSQELSILGPGRIYRVEQANSNSLVGRARTRGAMKFVWVISFRKSERGGGVKPAGLCSRRWICRAFIPVPPLRANPPSDAERRDASRHPPRSSVLSLAPSRPFFSLLISFPRSPRTPAAPPRPLCSCQLVKLPLP